MKINLSSTKKGISLEGLTALLAAFFFLFIFGGTLKAQDNIHFGFRGGLGMSTLTCFENNGLKLGLTCGVCGQYNIAENQKVLTEIYYSTGGQQSEKWRGSRNEQIKVYSKYNLHYVNLPIIYQYYFTDILGVEAGPNLRYCLNGTWKTKIGNENWHSESFSTGNYNSFDFGLIIGVFTSNLLQHDDVFVSLRAYFGFLDVIKDVGANKNIGVQVSVGYMLF